MRSTPKKSTVSFILLLVCFCLLKLQTQASVFQGAQSQNDLFAPKATDAIVNINDKTEKTLDPETDESSLPQSIGLPDEGHYADGSEVHLKSDFASENHKEIVQLDVQAVDKHGLATDLLNEDDHLGNEVANEAHLRDISLASDLQVVEPSLPFATLMRVTIVLVATGITFRNRKLVVRWLRITSSWVRRPASQLPTVATPAARETQGSILSVLSSGIVWLFSSIVAHASKVPHLPVTSMLTKWKAYYKPVKSKTEDSIPLSRTSSSMNTTQKKPNIPRKSSKDDEPQQSLSTEKRIAQRNVAISSGTRIPSLVNIPTTFTSIISSSMLSLLVPQLPERLRFTDLSLMYGSDLHGYNLQTAYRRCMQQGPFIIAVMDTNRYVFGAFCSVSLKLGPSYYGTGESFLIQFGPDFAVHRWTGANHHIVISNDKYLAFGGGGCFGLWLDETFDKGTSHGPCETYRNPPLASQESFKVVSVEIWGFRNPMLAG